MTVELCPVCHGNGLVPAGFYSTYGNNPYNTVLNEVAPEKCRSCDGKGYIVVDIEHYEPKNTAGENG